jgi:hypothetical protein
MYFMLIRMPLRQGRATFIGGIVVLQSGRWATEGGGRTLRVRNVPGARFSSRGDPPNESISTAFTYMSTESDFKLPAEEDFLGDP